MRLEVVVARTRPPTIYAQLGRYCRKPNRSQRMCMKSFGFDDRMMTTRAAVRCDEIRARCNCGRRTMPVGWRALQRHARIFELLTRCSSFWSSWCLVRTDQEASTENVILECGSCSLYESHVVILLFASDVIFFSKRCFSSIIYSYLFFGLKSRIRRYEDAKNGGREPTTLSSWQSGRKGKQSMKASSNK